MSWAKFGPSSRRIIVSGTIIAVTAIALILGSQRNAVEAVSKVAGAELGGGTTFPGTGTGAIPDAPAGGTVCGDYGAPRNVTFTVTGMSTPLSDVQLSLTGTHTWVGDLEVTLIAPDGTTTATIFKQVGAATVDGCGDNSDLGGPYVFFDTAPAAPTFWTAATTAGAAVPVAAGNYRATAPLTGAVTAITPVFAGIASANGTWTLRVRDGGEGDTGSITAASLTLTGGVVAPAQHVVDFNGDGRTDFAVVRNTGGGPSGQVTWFTSLNGPGTGSGAEWGIATDFFVPGDFDGDDKTDVTVWRPGAAGTAGFYILQSATSTFRFEQFGQTGDDPTVIGDYDGDGQFDPAVYRAGAAAGQQSTWYYRGSMLNPLGNVTFVPWGQNGDFPAPGDYDGDGKGDFAVQRNNGNGQARFWIQQTTDGFTSVVFGTPTDVIVPGDYDGDGKTDVAVVRGISGTINWFYEPSGTAGTTVVQTAFGASATDFPTQGDYDGDGKTDQAIWRPNADPTQNYFWYNGSTSGVALSEWGQNGDYPVANYNSH